MDDNGPRFLNSLRGMLPSFIRGLATGHIGGKGKQAPIKGKPCTCDVCRIGFLSPKEFEPAKCFCATCAELLKQEYIAIVCPEREQYAFITSPSLADLKGQVIHVSGKVMKKLAKEFAQNKNNNGEEKQSC